MDEYRTREKSKIIDIPWELFASRNALTATREESVNVLAPYASACANKLLSSSVSTQVVSAIPS